MSWQDQQRNDLGQFQGFGGGGGTGFGAAAGYASGVLNIAKALEGASAPFISATVQNGKYRAARLAGENALAIERKWNYFFQQQTVERGPHYQPTLLDIGSIMQLHHQQPFGDADPNVLWQITKDRLAYYGIDLALPNDDAAPGEAQDWTRVLQMAATAAPLGAAIIDMRRAEARGEELLAEAKAELDFAFRRAGISRPEDRAMLTNPWYSWSIGEAQQLLWMGVINVQQFQSLCAAAGLVNDDDSALQRSLSPVRQTRGRCSNGQCAAFGTTNSRQNTIWTTPTTIHLSHDGGSMRAECVPERTSQETRRREAARGTSYNFAPASPCLIFRQR